MWDDEDNNPYGSFTRRDSEGSEVQGNNPQSLGYVPVDTN